MVDPARVEELGSGDDGELWIRGPQVMRGYLADDEATAATLTEDGWLKTGDVARVDEDGSFRIFVAQEYGDSAAEAVIDAAEGLA